MKEYMYQTLPNEGEKPIFNPSGGLKVTGPLRAYELFKQHWDVDLMGFLEEFKVMTFDKERHLIEVHDILLQGLYFPFNDADLIFDVVIKDKASSFIFAHNRTAGSIKPYKEERWLARLLAWQAHHKGMKLQDHLIITRDSYYSFLLHGLLEHP